MTMGPARRRRHGPDLLGRPPNGGPDFDRGWSAWMVDRAAQLEALDDLRNRGLLSDEEYEAYKANVLLR